MPCGFKRGSQVKLRSEMNKKLLKQGAMKIEKKITSGKNLLDKSEVPSYWTDKNRFKI